MATNEALRRDRLPDQLHKTQDTVTVKPEELLEGSGIGVAVEFESGTYFTWTVETARQIATAILRVADAGARPHPTPKAKEGSYDVLDLAQSGGSVSNESVRPAEPSEGPS